MSYGTLLPHGRGLPHLEITRTMLVLPTPKPVRRLPTARADQAWSEQTGLSESKKMTKTVSGRAKCQMRG